MEWDDRPLVPVAATIEKRTGAPAQKLVGAADALLAAAYVLYPVYYLFQAAVDVGDPNVRPPEAYGLDNFALLPNYSEIMLNTLGVAFAATVMALVFGFVIAWFLSLSLFLFCRCCC